MSAICVFVPVVADLAWPVLAAAVTTALSSAGYAAAADRASASVEDDAAAREAAAPVELDLPQAQAVSGELGEEQVLAFEKEVLDEKAAGPGRKLTLSFRKASDGRLKVCAECPGMSEERLRRAGLEAVNAFVQSFVNQRLQGELKKRGYRVQEELLEDGSVRLKARRG